MYLFKLHAINFIAHLLLLFGIKQAVLFTIICMLWLIMYDFAQTRFME